MGNLLRYRYWIFASLFVTGAALADNARPGDKPAAPAPVAPVPMEAAAASAEVKAGTGVEKHEIVGEASTFALGTTVWVWSRITNAQGTVKHVWKLDGKEVWSATLPVGSTRWTTMSRRAISAKGAWEVDVQTDAGASIGSVSFKVE
jgi:hypothetical protein